jgi:hypothetical protein
VYLLPTTARSAIIVADDSFYTRLLKSARAGRMPGTAERRLHFFSNLRDDVDARGFL